MKSKTIIFTTIIFFIFSASSLAWIEKKQSNENTGKNWWVLYFAEPKSDKLNFIIENHSDENNFHWEILSNKKKIQEGEAEIKKGSALQLNPDLALASENKKITILVISKDEKKEIYKNL
ncbi:MAG: hypothetical protein COX29_03630 [Candidatus Moranbacteria bacterium CG23_combo_of_CG06-09_8_20_14_all_35_22]|nr:MAG: hypothetical protein COX29_03630 [Candidatus Moranbacteria bacterium CG23_combo_of_CG06-09_8_20_14_all_35_22]